jgi:hypothetical protein
MGMDMCATRNVRDRFSDWAAIFDDWLFLGQSAHGDFVAEGDIMQQSHAAGGFAFQRHHADFAALFQILNRDSNVVDMFM